MLPSQNQNQGSFLVVLQPVRIDFLSITRHEHQGWVLQELWQGHGIELLTTGRVNLDVLAADVHDDLLVYRLCDDLSPGNLAAVDYLHDHTLFLDEALNQLPDQKHAFLVSADADN